MPNDCCNNSDSNSRLGITGFSDPYVIVAVGAQKKKTKKIMQTLVSR